LKPVLLLATHGFFAKESAVPEPPILAQGGLRDFRMDARLTGPNPGLLSGIVFAGVNSAAGFERTVLTALEAAELNLEGTELVVLSACNTGQGKVAGGEGVLGLQRAFQITGVRTTITSLWKVGDEETHQLMREFYKRLWNAKEPMSRMEALRQAQLWMLDPTRRGPLRPDPDRRPPLPFTWAAFVLAGDWR
jgi:CHAT domain-containing protein